jgi:hypothetical protein
MSTNIHPRRLLVINGRRKDVSVCICWCAAEFEVTPAPVSNGIVLQIRHQAPLRCILAKNGAQNDKC